MNKNKSNKNKSNKLRSKRIKNKSNKLRSKRIKSKRIKNKRIKSKSKRIKNKRNKSKLKCVKRIYGGNYNIYIRNTSGNIETINLDHECKESDLKKILINEHRHLFFEGKQIEIIDIERIIKDLKDDGEIYIDDRTKPVAAPEPRPTPEPRSAAPEPAPAAPEPAEPAPPEPAAPEPDQPLPEGGVKIFVKLPNGNTIEFDNITDDVSVSEIKRRLIDSHDFACGSSRLIFSGRELKDDDRISKYNIAGEDEMNIVARRNYEIPLEINVYKDDKYYVNYCGEHMEPDIIDKNYHCRGLTEKLNELIDSQNKYNLYLSIGSNCLHYDGAKYTNCMNGQIKLPGGWTEPGLTNKVFVIDYGIDIEKYTSYVSEYYSDDEYEFFDMLWFDDALELIDTLSNFIVYNKEGGGKCLCINYVKFSSYRNKNPIFENLVRLFNGEDNFGKKNFDKRHCISNRTLYLDHIYQTGTLKGDKTLVEFNHSTTSAVTNIRQTLLINDINNIDDESNILPYYFETDNIIF
jgi:hypothetical protein